MMMIMIMIMFVLFQVMEQRWNEIDRGKPKYSGKTCSRATLLTTNSTWTDPGSNPGLRGGRPAANRVSLARPLGGSLWSDLGFLPFVRKGSGTTMVKGVVKRVISDAQIKHEVSTVRLVASYITHRPAMSCKKDKRYSFDCTCLLEYRGIASIAVVSHDMVSSGGTIQCRVVYPCTRPDLHIGIRH
jgi:hypothetical protein